MLQKQHPSLTSTFHPPPIRHEDLPPGGLLSLHTVFVAGLALCFRPPPLSCSLFLIRPTDTLAEGVTSRPLLCAHPGYSGQQAVIPHQY